MNIESNATLFISKRNIIFIELFLYGKCNNTVYILHTGSLWTLTAFDFVYWSEI